MNPERTIDITPPALKTAEGAARAQAAAREMDNAIHACAMALQELEEPLAAIAAGRVGVDVSGQYKAEAQDALDALQRWRTAGEELVRAVSGH